MLDTLNHITPRIATVKTNLYLWIWLNICIENFTSNGNYTNKHQRYTSKLFLHVQFLAILPVLTRLEFQGVVPNTVNGNSKPIWLVISIFHARSCTDMLLSSQEQDCSLNNLFVLYVIPELINKIICVFRKQSNCIQENLLQRQTTTKGTLSRFKPWNLQPTIRLNKSKFCYTKNDISYVYWNVLS